jgi:enoyl-CoA hydratase
MSDIVQYEVHGRVGVITLNRPDARNAVNGDVASGVEAAIDQLEADPEVWVGVLRANTEGQEKPVFCAGADLKAINSGQAGGLNTRKGGFAGFVYRERTKPIIVAVDGLATAGGCEIVLAADLVVATTRSAFGLAEVKRNLIAGAGGLFRLPRAIGQAPAMEMILTGEPTSSGSSAGSSSPARRSRPRWRSPPRSRLRHRWPCGRAARSSSPPRTPTTTRSSR